MIGKNIRLAVILRDKKRFAKTVRAPAGQLFTEAGVDAVLRNEAELLEKFFPGRDFRLVPLSNSGNSGHFKFVEISKEAEAC